MIGRIGLRQIFLSVMAGLVATGSAWVHAQPIFIQTLGGSPGNADGQFDNPRGLALDAAGNLYVADSGNDRIQRFDYTAGGLTHAYSFGTAGPGNGQFGELVGLAVDSAGNVFTVDSQYHRVQKFTPVAGSLQFAFATGSQGALLGQFDRPQDISIDSAGDLYVLEQTNARMQVLSQGPASLTPITTFDAGGEMDNPSGVSVSSDGTIYVVDNTINKMWSAARLGTVVGQTGSAELSPKNPVDVAVSHDGSLYLSLANPKALESATYNGSVLTPVDAYVGPAGNPLMSPNSVALDERGNIYLSDPNTDRVIRLFDPAAIAPGNTGQLENLILGASGQQFTMLLPGDRALEVVGSTVVEPGAVMTILSDQFSTQNLGVFGGTYDGPIAGVTALTFLSGTLDVTDEDGLNIIDSNLTGGSLDLSVGKTLRVDHTLTVDVTGTLTLRGGAASAQTLVNNGTLNASGSTMTLTSEGSINDGTVNLTSGGLRLTNAMTNNALITIIGSVLRVDGAVTNTPTAQIDVTGLSTLRFDTGATNEGLIRIDGGDTIVSGSVTNAAAGTIDLINTALVTFSASVNNQGTINVEANSNAQFDSTYSGGGDITGGGRSTFSSTLEPGGDLTATTTIAGDAELQGTLEIQIGGPIAGTDFDQLIVVGELTLGGSLLIELINDYAPLTGESFLIIDAGSGITLDAFSQVNGLTITAGNIFDLVYDETLQQVRLNAPVVLAGDTDGDGDIDDSDLGTSFANYTGPIGDTGNKTAADGDTDADGDVDDSDLGSSFAGYTGPLTPVNVPEPGMALTGLLGLVLVTRTRCAGRRCARLWESARGAPLACRSAT